MTTSTPLITSRRTFLGQTAALGLAALPLQAEAAGRSSLLFAVRRDDKALGFHRIDFAEQDERLIVDIEIAFDYKLAFVPLYRYRHRNREVWEGDRLLSMASETDDNGDSFAVEAERKGDRLLVDGAEGKLELPGNTFTTSYWKEAAMAKNQWLDTQAGTIVRSEVTKQSKETIEAGGRTVDATPYDLEGDLTCKLWYAEGRWVKLNFVADGAVIDYALEASQQNG